MAAYLERKRNDEALQLTWVQFEERPSLEHYKKLHAVAGKLGLLAGAARPGADQGSRAHRPRGNDDEPLEAETIGSRLLAAGGNRVVGERPRCGLDGRA